MDDSDLFSAQYGPGYCDDLTYWQVFISRNRWLRQKVVVYHQGTEFHNHVLWFWAKLSRQDMAKLWEIVDRIGFRGFRRWYSHEKMIVTNLDDYLISVRFPDHLKEVYAYALPMLSDEQQPDMIGMAELWRTIISHTPYGKVPMAEGLPRPWWRCW